MVWDCMNDLFSNQFDLLTYESDSCLSWNMKVVVREIKKKKEYKTNSCEWNEHNWWTNYVRLHRELWSPTIQFSFLPLREENLFRNKCSQTRVTEPIYQVVGNEMIDIKLQPYSFLENNINQSMIRQIRYILNIVRRSSDFYNIDHCS